MKKSCRWSLLFPFLCFRFRGIRPIEKSTISDACELRLTSSLSTRSCSRLCPSRDNLGRQLPPVQEALDELRAKLGECERIDFAELVTLGAKVKVRRMATEDAAAATARRGLAERIRTGSFRYAVDVEAADEVKRLGLIANYDA
jgi:hypothetical protein